MTPGLLFMQWKQKLVDDIVMGLRLSSWSAMSSLALLQSNVYLIFQLTGPGADSMSGLLTQ